MKQLLLIVISTIAFYAAGQSQDSRQLSIDKPQAIADLRSAEGAALVQARWFVQPAQIVETAFRSPGPGAADHLLLYPTGMKQKTHTIHPQINAPDFDRGFIELKPTDLEMREGMGLVSAAWYRLTLTIPQTVGKFSAAGSLAVFEAVVDDYSEIWVNGKQARAFGQIGSGVISGYNSRNRVVLSDHARPGDQFSISILGINGPLGMIPDNYIWIRNAVIDFYKEQPVKPDWNNIGKIYSVDPALNEIIGAHAQVDKIAEGFQFTEGPVWHPDGFLLFSDPNTNSIYRFDPSTYNVSIFVSHSGYTGVDIGEYGQPGSNGLTIDREGRLIADQHGNRRVVRYEKKGPVTILADNIDGKRFNSPNDIVQKSDGTIYFTDPPYGLPGFFKDQRKELDYSGVFMIREGHTTLVSKDLGGPNGIAFSPDEHWLYVTNWDIRDIHHTKTIWRYEVKQNGTLAGGRIFFDCNQTEDDEALDGMKVDRAGNLFVSAPGGVWIISAEGKLLGKIVTPERPANMAWGDADGKTLYLTAHSSIYRIRVLTGGKFAWQ